jgi:anthranilate/para-aminobenzoate synthase component II
MKKKVRKKLDEATLASVKKELAKPRMARSASKEEVNLNTARISEHARTTMPGIVDKIILSPRPSKPEKAQVAIDGIGQRRQSPQ